tara:strand:- start:3564 stop:3938 length:375 start_codon:yes stop_codon:yes gene_type:complete
MNVIENYLKEEEWIGIDLDKTLAYYDEWKGIEHIGKPIKPMVDILLDYINKGIKVKIFTARVHEPKSIPYIKKWLKDNNLPDLEITNVKDFSMKILYDDRCVQVEPNTGKLIIYPSRYTNIYNY